MCFAAGEVNAEMAVKVIVLDGLCPVRHPVHGSCVNVPVILHQDGTPLPAPMSEDAFHNLRIRRCRRLAVRMVRAGPALDGKNLSCADILYFKRRVIRNML